MTKPNEDWETRMEQTAKGLPYPPTPDLAARLRRQRQGVDPRRMAQAAAALGLVLVALLAVPEIRAQVLSFLRIGAVEIVVTTATPPAIFNPQGELPQSVLDFPGATTLEDAQLHAGYPINLPEALGSPDRVYLVQAARPIVVLAWLDDTGAIDVSLHLLPPITYSLKSYEGTLEVTEVNGERAVWLPNPHWIMMRTDTGDYDTQMRLVTMHALVWAEGDGNANMTYRLETNRPLDEALQIAESIPVGNGQLFGGVSDRDDG